MNARPAPDPALRVPPGRGGTWLVAGLIALAGLLAYRGTFAVPFVFDDQQAIADNYSIRSFATAWSPPPETTVTGRPIVNLSLALNYALGGLGVRGYHALNLAIHLLAALTLFGVLRRTLLRQGDGGQALRLAFSIALLWSVHPLQTESVTYTIQRAESLMGLFYLLTLYAFIRGTGDAVSGERGSRAWLALSFVACLLGMATKEVIVSAPLIVLLYDRTFVAGTFRDALRVRRWYYVALVATWLVLATLVISSEGRGSTAGLGTKIPPLDYALTQCHAIVHYLRLAIWPAPLVFDYGNATVTAWSAVFAPALLVLVAGTLIALRARPVLGFLGAWFFAILAPSSSVLPIATQTIAEHRMYLSLAAVLTLLVVALHRWAGPRRAIAVVMIAATGLTALTNQRNATYHDALTLWTDTVAKAPDNVRARTDLGLTLLSLGRVAEAHEHFAAAVRLRPNQADTHINYANVLAREERFADAIAELTFALRLEPDSLDALNNLGITFAQRGRLAEAIAQFERAVQLKPASAESHGNLARALLESGRTDEALAHYAECARLRPLDPIIHDNYGVALLKAQRPTEATAEFESALRITPQSALAHNHLGLALAATGRLPEAQREFARAVQLQPDFAEAAQNLARARAESP